MYISEMYMYHHYMNSREYFLSGYDNLVFIITNEDIQFLQFKCILVTNNLKLEVMIKKPHITRYLNFNDLFNTFL